jgi:hypothetical protein
MDQQGYSNFLTMSTALGLTIKFPMEVETNNTLQFSNDLVMKQGPELITKVYRKPTHTGCYLHFKSNYPHHVRTGVVHSLLNRAKVICQNHKDFNNKIKTIRHDLMLNEYPKEFVDSVTKLSIRNRPTSDTAYQGMALSSSCMLRAFPRNSGALGTISVSEQSSRLDIHSMGL